MTNNNNDDEEEEDTCSIEGEQCTFRCTGYDGSVKWQALHDIVDSIECEECRQHAKKLMNGMHDLVNLGLGKNAYDSDNFEDFVNEVNCVYSACKKNGSCKLNYYHYHHDSY